MARGCRPDRIWQMRAAYYVAGERRRQAIESGDDMRWDAYDRAMRRLRLVLCRERQCVHTEHVHAMLRLPTAPRRCQACYDPLPEGSPSRYCATCVDDARVCVVPGCRALIWSPSTTCSVHTCSVCGDGSLHDDMLVCASCGDRAHQGCAVWYGGLCEHCAPRCPECGHAYDPDWGCLRPECEPDAPPEACSHLHDYGSAPRGASRARSATGRYVRRTYGCELEWARGVSAVEVAKDLGADPPMWVGEDSSVAGELHSWVHGRLASLEADIRAGCERISALGARAWGHRECGLHVHIGKDSIGPLTIWKISRFLHSRTSIILGRRYCASYASVSNLDTKALAKWLTCNTHSWRNHAWGDKYRALRIHHRTVEWRAPAATLDADMAYGCVETFASLVAWAENESLRTITLDAYITWLASQTGWRCARRYVYDALRRARSRYPATPHPSRLRIADPRRNHSHSS